MPIRVRIENSKKADVAVKVRRPHWQEFIHY